jgi:hypothetical protein
MVAVRSELFGKRGRAVAQARARGRPSQGARSPKPWRAVAQAGVVAQTRGVAQTGVVAQARDVKSEVFTGLAHGVKGVTAYAGPAS